MATKESKNRAHYKYAKKNLKRIPLDVQNEFYNRIKTAADSLGMPVNTYIKNAISVQLEKDNPQDS